MDLRNDATLTTETVIAILISDLPLMTEAQLAAMLTDIILTDPSPFGHALEPLVRMELGRRRLLESVEAVAANV